MQPKVQVTALAKKVTATATATARHHSTPFRHFPKVPSTQYLEANELSRDIFYSGYRPVMYPLRENPLFFRSKYPQEQNTTDVSDFRVVKSDDDGSAELPHTSTDTDTNANAQIKNFKLGRATGVGGSDGDNTIGEHDTESDVTAIRDNLIFGKDGLGGIATCGATGVWRNEPTTKLKAELQRSSSLWNGSSLRMELYREWRNVPNGVVRRLKPFDDGVSGKV